jgi:hypothetical protein
LSPYLLDELAYFGFSIPANDLSVISKIDGSVYEKRTTA